MSLHHYTGVIASNVQTVMPPIMYGTAWKKENTTLLVIAAVLAGFKGIDTACQPMHYREDLVGNAVTELGKSFGKKRESLFIQTKFTLVEGQDPKSIPYDPKAPIPEQVKQSIQVSLKNLGTNYIDSYVLHGPYDKHEDNMLAWGVLEQHHKNGILKQIGLSNVYELDVLKKIYSDAQIKPSVLQNRFYKDTNFDKEIREFCKSNNIQYQSFWTLSHNPELINNTELKAVAAELNKSPQQIFYRAVMDLGIVPLDGTTNPKHMLEDLEVPLLSPVIDRIPTVKKVIA
ncbi:oxidoreductase [Acrasis kona]|uniref:Oxidoreductase n=1 Tax=Acrasis kona TaxID=1008807 RepID=A0AAW2YZJ8_9EUKA